MRLRCPRHSSTVWLDVFDLGGLKPGETLLVHGGSSGIGITAIQLAKALGSRVFITAGSDEKCEACRALGADVAINYRVLDFEKELHDVDVILDMIGGSYTIKNLRILSRFGRLVYINTMESPKAEVDLSVIMARQLILTGSHLRPQSTERKAEIARDLEARVWPLIAEGRIKPVIDSVYPLEDATAAHRHMESSRHIGKIVLKIGLERSASRCRKPHADACRGSVSELPIRRSHARQFCSALIRSPAPDPLLPHSSNVTAHRSYVRTGLPRLLSCATWPGSMRRPNTCP